MRLVAVTDFDECYADQRPRVYVSLDVLRRRMRRRRFETRLLPRLVGRDQEAMPSGEVWDIVRSIGCRFRESSGL